MSDVSYDADGIRADKYYEGGTEMTFYLWTIENPGKATAILVAAALAAAIAAIAYRMYRKKHPATIKIVYDYRKPETKKVAGGCILRRFF